MNRIIILLKKDLFTKCNFKYHLNILCNNQLIHTLLIFKDVYFNDFHAKVSMRFCCLILKMKFFKYTYMLYNIYNAHVFNFKFFKNKDNF